MDSGRFDTLVRSFTRLPSRRDILHGFIGAGAGLGGLRLETAGARRKHHKKRKNPKPQGPPSPPAPTCTPRCGRKRCGDDGCGGSCGGCGAGQFCRTGTCCTPRSTKDICTFDCGINAPCPGRCDTLNNVGTCGQTVACSCPAGQTCLSNGSCGQVCASVNDCPGPFSNCSNCDASTEGPKHCTENFPNCSEPTCTSTADCPVGSHCQPTTCGPNHNDNRCVALSSCPG